MSNTAPAPTTAATSRSAAKTSSTGSALNSDTSRGTTKVDDGVVEKIAGIAARDVRGVHDLGGGAARAIGALRNRINQTDQGQGISVEVGETQAAVDITVVAEYPVALHRLADDIRSAVIESVESLVGLQVTEVNVEITDVFIPSDDADTDAAPRVQ
jgi:uncharacterized alkaline shock family protein YloU